MRRRPATGCGSNWNGAKRATSRLIIRLACGWRTSAGHGVGQADKPLLNNVLHQGTGAWASGAVERDYYLLPVDPAAPPGTYHLKTVLYTADGRRLAPQLPDIGADLAAALGEVSLNPPAVAPDPAALPKPAAIGFGPGRGAAAAGIRSRFYNRLAAPRRPDDPQPVVAGHPAHVQRFDRGPGPGRRPADLGAERAAAVGRGRPILFRTRAGGGRGALFCRHSPARRGG